MTSAEWKTSGTRAVYRILVRRRLKCQRAGQHDSQWQGRACRNCGVLG